MFALQNNEFLDEFDKFFRRALAKKLSELAPNDTEAEPTGAAAAEEEKKEEEPTEQPEEEVVTAKILVSFYKEEVVED